MKIKQLTAHYIESDIQDVSTRTVGPYIRVLLPTDEVHWLMAHYGYDPVALHSGKPLVALEREFNDTFGVMHEQLELPLNYE